MVASIGFVLCLWLMSFAVYAAARKRTAALFVRDPADPSFGVPSTPPGQPCHDAPNVHALAPTALKCLEHDSALLPVCVDGDEARLVGPQVEAKHSLHG